MNCAAVILAAGASSRMGRPKALLNYRGERFLERLLRIFSAVCGDVVVVLGHHADALQPLVRPPARSVVNPDPGRGQLSSLHCGLSALTPGQDAFFFQPVDYPAISESTVATLLDTLSIHPPALVAIPRHGGRRGHPVLCRIGLAEELLALPASGQARDVIHRHVAETRYVDVEDPGILTDIDDPAAYARLLGGTPA